MEALSHIQCVLAAPKNAETKFGGYKYRTAESILEAVKPLLNETGSTVTLSDDLVLVGDRYYVKATATFTCKSESFSVSAFAREALQQKGMVEPMLTGSSSSYARKYALNGLFAIDNSEQDPDTKDNRNYEPVEEVCRTGQVEAIEKLITESNSDKSVFCNYFSIKTISELKQKDHATAVAMLNAKIKNGSK